MTYYYVFLLWNVPRNDLTRLYLSSSNSKENVFFFCYIFGCWVYFEFHRGPGYFLLLSWFWSHGMGNFEDHLHPKHYEPRRYFPFIEFTSGKCGSATFSSTLYLKPSRAGSYDLQAWSATLGGLSWIVYSVVPSSTQMCPPVWFTPISTLPSSTLTQPSIFGKFVLFELRQSSLTLVSMPQLPLYHLLLHCQS